MKSAVVLCFGVVAAVSGAQTLQWTTKYTINESSPTNFRKVVRADATHFWVAGTCGNDVVIARVDQFGNVLGSVQYDSPILGADSVVDLASQDDGSLVLMVATRNQVTNVQEKAYVLKYSPALLKQWEWETPGAGICDSLAVAALPNGAAVYATIRRGSDLFASLVRLNGVGAQTNSASVNFANVGGQVRSIAANPATGGCVVMGQTGARELLEFYSSALVVNQKNGPGPDNSVNAIFKGYVTGGGIFYGVGRYNSGSTQGAFYICDGAVLTRTNIASAHTATDIEPAPGFAYAIASSTVGSEHVVARLNTTTNVATTIYNATGTPIPTVLGVDPTGTRFYTFAASQHRARKTSDSGIVFTSAFPSGQTIVDFAVRNPQGVIGVGQNSLTGSGLIQISDTIAGTRSFYRHVGGQPYNVVGADTDLSGAQVVAMKDLATSQITRIVKFRPDGTIAWARTVPAGINFQDLDVANDGTVAIAGYDGDAIAMRYSAAGTLSWVRRYTMDGDSIYATAVAIRSDGRIFIGGSGSNRDFVVATEPDGTLAWMSDVDTAGISSSLVDMRLIGDDTLALLSQRNDVSFGTFFGAFTTVATLDGALGGTANIGYFNDEGGEVWMTTTSSSAFVASRSTFDSSVNVTRFGPAQTGLYGLTDIATIGAMAADGTNLFVAYRTTGNVWRLKATTIAGGALWDVVLDATILSVNDIQIDLAGRPNLLATETSTFGFNSYLARYLLTGVRSSVRRVSGKGAKLSLVGGVGSFVIGTNPVRAKGQGPIVTRYN